MKECWADDKETRPTFHELKQIFDGLISQDVQYRYLRLGSLLPEAGLLAPTAEGVEAPSQPAAPSDCEQQAQASVTDMQWRQLLMPDEYWTFNI